MDKQTHTPGPWRAKERDSSDGHTIFRDVQYVAGASTTTYRIATVWYPSSGAGTVGAAEREANAHLIAAAPDLLDALTALLHKIDIPQQTMGLAADIFRARAAIAKATGASHE